jgi:hypothetical protein
MKDINKGYSLKNDQPGDGDNSSSSGGTDQLIAIRKPRPGELFFRPGNAVFMYCLKTKAITGSGDVVEIRYRPVPETALHAILADVVPVLFHETYTENGEQYAFPQVLHKDRLVPAAWRKCEREVFRHRPLHMWMAIEYDSTSGEYVLGIDDCNEAWLLPDPDFARKLDTALAPNLIDEVNHPVVRRLSAQFGCSQENDALQEWGNVG